MIKRFTANGCRASKWLPKQLNKYANSCHKVGPGSSSWGVIAGLTGWNSLGSVQLCFRLSAFRCDRVICFIWFIPVVIRFYCFRGVTWLMRDARWCLEGLQGLLVVALGEACGGRLVNNLRGMVLQNYDKINLESLVGYKCFLCFRIF